MILQYIYIYVCVRVRAYVCIYVYIYIFVLKLQKLKTFLKKETAGKEISVPLAIEETCTLTDLTKRMPELTKMTKVWKIPLKLLKNSTHHAINSKKYVNN